MLTKIMKGRFPGLISKAAKKGIRVLCYHGVVERRTDLRLERNLTPLSDFRSQVHSLRRLDLVSLEELLHELSASSKRRKPLCAITFDDGYANNLLAGELLAEAHLPWAVFISTGAVGRDKAIWTLELSLLLLHGRADKVDIMDRVWPLTSRRDREAAFQGIRFPLKEMPGDLSQKAMAVIRAQFPPDETRRLLNEFPSLQMLTWEEVGQLAQAGVEIGSHGVNHEIHHVYQLASIRQRELVESKTELERRLGKPCRFFSFPNGSFSAFSEAEVRAAGYDLAFTLEPRAILPGESPWLLPRLAPPAASNKFAGDFFGFRSWY